MATTTNYGWTTPDDTALVKDGASAIRSLGTSVDTTTKNLNPSTTLGDIEYRSSTSNTNTRLGIGTTGQLLTVSGGVPAWATDASGLKLINSTSFSAVSSQSLNSVFSATYDNYRIVISYTGAGAASPVQVKMRMRASGSDNTGTYYTANYYYSGGTFTNLSYDNNTGFLAGYASNNTTEGPSLAVIDIMNPFPASATVMQGDGQTFLSNLGFSYTQRLSGTSFAATSFDGFTLIPASSTITGKVRVYGYSN
jgi:hypothetical protein